MRPWLGYITCVLALPSIHNFDSAGIAWPTVLTATVNYTTPVGGEEQLTYTLSNLTMLSYAIYT